MALVELQQYRMTIPRRGITVAAPDSVAQAMRTAQEHKATGTRYTEEERQSLWSERERARIWLMKNCTILRNRYPTREDGEAFMGRVDPRRQVELLGMAYDLTDQIVEEWGKINQTEPIAVVLFGSVAKGLAKYCKDPDPSNIDLAVMGNITDGEKWDMLDAIRPHRKAVKERIIAECSPTDSQEINPGNAGVFVQDLARLTNNNYSGAMGYITSGARPLYDPTNIWGPIEAEALDRAAVKMRKHAQSNKGIIYSR